MVYELIVLGSLWFWLLVVGFGIAGLISVANEVFECTFGIILVFIVGMFLFGPFSLGYVRENYTQILYGIGLYGLGGVIVGTMKWYFLSRDAREGYDNLKTEFCKLNNIPFGTIPENLRKDWNNYLNKIYQRNWTNHDYPVVTMNNIVPNVRENKAKIINWMTYWPFVAILSLVEDFVIRIWKMIYERISIVYQKIANYVFRDIEEEITFIARKEKQ